MRSCATLLAVLFVLHLSGYAADESKLIALENAWNQAQLNHDARALETLVGEKFIYTDIDGSVMDRARFLDDIRKTSYHDTLVTNEDVRVDMYGDAAVVSGTYHTKGNDKGKPFEHYGRFTDTWIRQKGQWQCVARHTTLLHK